MTEMERAKAMARFAVLRPFLDAEISLARAAAGAGVSIRTAQRWLARYRANGLPGLVRHPRMDAGRRKIAAEVVATIEGMALRKPRPSIATIYRRLTALARDRGWTVPSLSSVHAIVSAMDPAMLSLTHDGPAVFRDRYELVHRFRSERPNAIWQTDHTQLDVLILDAGGKTVRPWLTVVIDDYSRAIAGYTVFLGAPSALQTSLALRQAIWRKQDPAWVVCGIPDVLYVDHGSDFTSTHLEQVAADLRMRITFSAIARPQGRGKIERLFGTLNTELLPELPGRLVGGRPATPPRLSLAELDAAIGEFIVGNYNLRAHKSTGVSPRIAWLGGGWLPRMPDSLEELDLLLVMVAKSRMVCRDGIRFQGLRYLDPTLAAYVGERVTIRYDPRDLAEVRVFYRNKFLCRAIDAERAGQAISLKDIQAARIERRRALRRGIVSRVERVADFLPTLAPTALQPALTVPGEGRKRPKLRVYSEGD